MIIGNGMLAKGFKKLYENSNEVVVFASGVSNSQSTLKSDYKREKDLLIQSLATLNKKTIIYFSTCSIEEPLASTLYTRHKKELEDYIQKEAKSYYIFRLPQVAGHSNNHKFFIYYLLYNIINNLEFKLWKNTTRNLIDLDDVVKIVSYLVENKLKLNNVINIASPYNILVPEYVKQIEKKLKVKASYELIDKGSAYSIDIDDILSILKPSGVNFLTQEAYLSNIIEKYYEDIK